MGFLLMTSFPFSALNVPLTLSWVESEEHVDHVFEVNEKGSFVVIISTWPELKAALVTRYPI